MKQTLKHLALLLPLGLAAGLFAEGQTGNQAAAEAKKAATAQSVVKSTEAAGQEVQRLVREFGEQRKDRLQERRALVERLQQAKTEEEKQRILEEMRQQQQQRIEQQREMARQIREQMQENRKISDR